MCGGEPLLCAAVALPATCGELVQGTYEGVTALVSCPIARYSTARVALQPGEAGEAPPDAPKAAAAVRAGLAFRRRLDLGARLRLEGDIPRGRGYGSSTADVAGALYAVGEALGQPFSAEDVARLAVSIEPSDSVMFPQLTLFDHRGASFFEVLGAAPPLTVLVLDPGGEVDTIAFNRLNHREALRKLAAQHREAFDLLRQGVRAGDAAAVGAAATLSARAHEAILPNPLLETAIWLACQVRALGVCRAHSGTLLGILLGKEAEVPFVTRFVARHLPRHVQITSYALVDGGPRPNALTGARRSRSS